MNKYINTFASSGDYETYKASSAFTTPNVAYIEDTKEVKYINDIADLYDIYGTFISGYGVIQPTIQSGASSTRHTLVGDKYMYKWTGGTITRIQYYGIKGIKTVENFSYTLTGSSVNFNSLFDSCSNLEYADLSGVDTRNVTDMNSVFSRCTSLKYIDISNWTIGANVPVSHFFDYVPAETIVMNNTDTTTFNLITGTAMTSSFSSPRSKVSIIRDGVSYKYQNGAWVEA